MAHIDDKHGDLVQPCSCSGQHLKVRQGIEIADFCEIQLRVAGRIAHEQDVRSVRRKAGVAVRVLMVERAAVFGEHLRADKISSIPPEQLNEGLIPVDAYGRTVSDDQVFIVASEMFGMEWEVPLDYLRPVPGREAVHMLRIDSGSWPAVVADAPAVGKPVLMTERLAAVALVANPPDLAGRNIQPPNTLFHVLPVSLVAEGKHLRERW